MNETDRHGVDAHAIAETIVGTPYSWGGGHGRVPRPSLGMRDGAFADSHGDYAKVGLDASGLARWFVHRMTGHDTADGSAELQYRNSRHVPAGSQRGGDLFFPEAAGIPHPYDVKVYLGGGEILNMGRSGERARIEALTEPGEFRRFADPVVLHRRGDLGFRGYGDPVQTSYGERIEVYESSAVGAAWLRVFNGDNTGIEGQQGRDFLAHLNVDDAIAVRDRLNAFIESEIGHA